MSTLDLAYAKARIQVGSLFAAGEVMPPANMVEVSSRLASVILSHSPEGLPDVPPTDPSEDWVLQLLREVLEDVSGEGTLGVTLRSVDLYDSPYGQRHGFEVQTVEQLWLWLLDSPALRWAAEHIWPLSGGIADQIIIYRNVAFEPGTRLRCTFTAHGFESVTHVDAFPLGLPSGKVLDLLAGWWKSHKAGLLAGVPQEDLDAGKWDALMALSPCFNGNAPLTARIRLIDLLPKRTLPNQAREGYIRWRDHSRWWEVPLAP